MFHAVVHLDHHQAQVLQFNAQECTATASRRTAT
jgi:hypothetical protein